MSEIKTKTGEVLDSPNLPRGVKFIRGAYWFLAVGGLLIFTAMFAGLGSISKISGAETAFTMIINLLVLYGLHKRKYWVVSLILFFSVGAFGVRSGS